MRMSRILFVPLVALLTWLMAGTPVQAQTLEMNMTIDEVELAVAPDLKYKVFAFNGQVPGPLIHAREHR